MKAFLVVEIVTALVACGCLIALLASWAGAALVRRRGKRVRLANWHGAVGVALCVAAAVHGVAAMVYASGANMLAYVLGWVAVAAFVASGACMMRSVRVRLGRGARAWHVGLMVAGIALVMAHAVAGRL